MTNANIQSNVLGHIGWKYYNTAKKKAMEQEFSWSGLAISLSIAFFIVVACSFILSLTYISIEKARHNKNISEQNIYHLEDVNHINIQAMEHTNIKYFKIAINRPTV